MKDKQKKTLETGETEFYTVRQVAEILCCTVATVFRMVRDGEISSTKPRGKRLIPKKEIHGLISGTWEPARPPEK